ncbi:MAG: bifunctional phosphoglucose/phosphomannose isomerase [Candidatus Saccharibacteria bacterium]|nr:bifunctional phosphoglucose/phosphomannose isomerase [Candidatus Saccharibacteria bacterium]
MFGHQDEPKDDSVTTTSDNPAASPTVGAPSDNPFEAVVNEVAAPVEPQTVSPQTDSAVVADVPTDDLAAIKQSALQQLSPLVGHLEQSPEEKFRTTMMMIQASDDHSLIKDAYEAAGNITDEKARAQALLDVVNEINYFTQHNAA